MKILSKCIFILTLLLFFIGSSAFAQKDKPSAPNDTLKLYRDLEMASKKSKFGKIFYNLFFTPISTIAPKVGNAKKYKKLIKKPYSAYEGKIIRNINIETLDPFGFSVKDTAVMNNGFLYKAGNGMHIKSQKSTIRNLLLFHPNQEFDSLIVKESERLIRNIGYVREVAFTVKSVPRSDSVDIEIREIDKWSIVPGLAFPLGGISTQLIEQNFLGLGHRFTNSATWYSNSRYIAFNTDYNIPNIRNSYINGNVHYGADGFRNFTKAISVDRPFFSPLAKWAAGALVMQRYRNDTISMADSLYELSKYKYNVQDFWGGNAFQLFKGNTENDRTTNFVSSLRFMRLRFVEKSIRDFDSLEIYGNENLYLASFGISGRRFVQDQYIFNYGITEDVPIGKIYSFSFGYQEKNNIGRTYLGTRIAWGNYYKWGYISTGFDYGSYFRASRPEQIVFATGLNYFTGLLEIGKWKFRQFFKAQGTFGVRQFVYNKLTFNDFYALNTSHIYSSVGVHRLLFTLQSQAYAPWNLFGFRFGPYFIYSMGMMGDARTGFRRSQVYSQVGFGLLVRNLNLVFSTFQISIAYYPFIPGGDENAFRFNPFKTTDFGFRTYDVGKPATVEFR